MEKKKRMALVLVAALLVASGYWGYRNYLNRSPATIEATGTIETTTFDLSAKIQGTIASVTVNAGDPVSRGQVVAELFRSDLTAQRERDALTVLKAEAALTDLQSGARDQEIEEAALALDTAKVQHEQAAADLKRLQSLHEAGAIPQAEYENAVNGEKLAANQAEAARIRLSLLESGSRPQQINAARVEVERSKAVLKAAEAVLEDLKIIAPIDGRVLSRNYEAGEYVNPGAPVVTIADVSDLWIRVYIPTTDLPYVKLGQQVTFTVSGAGRIFQGVVEEIASKGEFTPKTIQTKQERANVVFGVKIRVRDADGALKPGMPADVVFGTKP